MVNFQLRYDEHTMLWSYKPDWADRWSEPMRYHKATAAIAREIQRESLEAEGKGEDLVKRWSRPLPIGLKSRKSDAEKHRELMDRYEIRGGRVQKIGTTAKERTEIEANELLAMLEGVAP